MPALAKFNKLSVRTLRINGYDVVTALLLASGQVVDLNGEADGLILDAAQNVRIDGSSTGKARFKISGAYDFEILANIFRSLSGSVIETNTINETTAASGVTIDGVLIKDAGLVVGASGAIDLNGETGGIIFDADANTKIYGSADDVITVTIGGAADFTIGANVLTALSGSSIATNTIAETTAASGVTIDGVLLKDGGAVFADAATIEVDTVNEATAAAGVTADGVLLKDGGSSGRRVAQALTASGAITAKTNGLVTLAHATVVIAATLAAPTAGDDVVIVNTSASGTVAHTVTLPAGVTWDGTNNTATLDAPEEALHVVAVSATRWKIMENIGSVALSTV